MLSENSNFKILVSLSIHFINWKLFPSEDALLYIYMYFPTGLGFSNQSQIIQIYICYITMSQTSIHGTFLQMTSYLINHILFYQPNPWGGCEFSCLVSGRQRLMVEWNSLLIVLLSGTFDIICLVEIWFFYVIF